MMNRNCSSNRAASGASQGNTGFRQRNMANFRKGSTSSFVIQQQIFVKDPVHQGGTDTERLKRLEFNVSHLDKKMSELDIKLEMILKTVLRPDLPTDV